MIAYVRSVFVPRCLVMLLIPQCFSRVGRYTITCYALVLILTGPATNTLKNSEVLSESMACGQVRLINKGVSVCVDLFLENRSYFVLYLGKDYVCRYEDSNSLQPIYLFSIIYPWYIPYWRQDLVKRIPSTNTVFADRQYEKRAANLYKRLK